MKAARCEECGKPVEVSPQRPGVSYYHEPCWIARLRREVDEAGDNSVRKIRESILAAVLANRKPTT